MVGYFFKNKRNKRTLPELKFIANFVFGSGSSRLLNADPDPVTDPRPDPVPGPGPSLTEIKGEITNRLLRGGKGGGEM